MRAPSTWDRRTGRSRSGRGRRQRRISRPPGCSRPRRRPAPTRSIRATDFSPRTRASRERSPRPVSSGWGRRPRRWRKWAASCAHARRWRRRAFPSSRARARGSWTTPVSRAKPGASASRCSSRRRPAEAARACRASNARKTCRLRSRRAGASPRPRSGMERSISSGCSTVRATSSSRSSATRPATPSISSSASAASSAATRRSSRRRRARPSAKSCEARWERPPSPRRGPWPTSELERSSSSWTARAAFTFWR